MLILQCLIFYLRIRQGSICTQMPKMYHASLIKEKIATETHFLIEESGAPYSVPTRVISFDWIHFSETLLRHLPVSEVSLRKRCPILQFQLWNVWRVSQFQNTTRCLKRTHWPSTFHFLNLSHWWFYWYALNHVAKSLETLGGFFYIIFHKNQHPMDIWKALF